MVEERVKKKRERQKQAARQRVATELCGGGSCHDEHVDSSLANCNGGLGAPVPRPDYCLRRS